MTSVVYRAEAAPKLQTARGARLPCVVSKCVELPSNIRARRHVACNTRPWRVVASSLAALARRFSLVGSDR
jgi:hypothetical protein